jgi:hypothetical protein
MLLLGLPLLLEQVVLQELGLGVVVGLNILLLRTYLILQNCFVLHIELVPKEADYCHFPLGYLDFCVTQVEVGHLIRKPGFQFI